MDGFDKQPECALIVREAAELALCPETAAAGGVPEARTAGDADAPEAAAPAAGAPEISGSTGAPEVDAAAEQGKPETETSPVPEGAPADGTVHIAEYACPVFSEHGAKAPGDAAALPPEPAAPAAGEVSATGSCAEETAAPPAPVKVLTNEEVTGHTASLWKYLPVPDTEPEQMPEYLSGTASYPASRIIAARVRGKKHKHEGTNCDDWYETSHFEDITFIAVADGAGSKKFSRVGARESCRAAVGYLVRTFGETLSAQSELRQAVGLPLSDTSCMQACGTLAKIVQQSVVKACEAVEAAYYSRTADPAYTAVLNRAMEFRDLSATLLIVVVIPIDKETKEQLVITCQIGDGMIALLNTKGEFSSSLKLMGTADSGEFSGETEFLTSPQMKQLETLQSRTKISRSIADLVLVMTDGVADDYFPNETELRRLYFDLVVNGILENRSAAPGLSAITAEQLRLLRKLPEALVYPWVNDQNVQIAVQYTKRICEATGLSLEEIWQDSTVLGLAGMELAERTQEADAGERLKVWLDNYVERGSFDDRTLVIAQM